jgi:hypothetical protein
MGEPQQPEMARTRRRGELEPEGKRKAREVKRGWANKPQPEESEAAGPMPEDNRPGHHPPKEQDKPEGPPPRRGA